MALYSVLEFLLQLHFRDKYKLLDLLNPLSTIVVYICTTGHILNKIIGNKNNKIYHTVVF